MRRTDRFDFVQTLQRLGGFERLAVDPGGVQAAAFLKGYGGIVRSNAYTRA
jgi:hypothetical protein